MQHNLYSCPNIISKGQLNQTDGMCDTSRRHGSDQCDTSRRHGSDQKIINTSAGKSRRLRSLARYGCSWEDNIKIDITEITFEDVAHDRKSGGLWS